MLGDESRCCLEVLRSTVLTLSFDTFPRSAVVVISRLMLTEGLCKVADEGGAITHCFMLHRYPICFISFFRNNYDQKQKHTAYKLIFISYPHMVLNALLIETIDHNDLTTIDLSTISASLLKYWKNLSYPKFLPTSTHTIITVSNSTETTLLKVVNGLFFSLNKGNIACLF